MSYGDHLAHAAGQLARAHTALRDPPPGPQARASAALSRVRLYRSLERQVVALGNVNSSDLPPVGESPVPHRWTLNGRDSVTALAIGLRYAPAATITANWTSRVDPPAAGPVAVALREAYRALQTAGDILASNTGAQVGLGRRHRPLTSEGMAVLAGLGRPDNLAVVARLAAAAADMDVRLVRWMWSEEAPDPFRPLLVAAEQDACQTKNGPLREAARLVSAAGDVRRAPVLNMAVAPAVDDPLRWASPGSRRDCVDAVDAARAWLTRHGGELTIGQLTSTARAALAITHYVGHVHLHLAHDASRTHTALVAAVRPWRRALEAATSLRSPEPAHADHSTLTVATGGAETWLRDQLRPAGQWLGPAVWAADPAGRAAWQETAVQITARMPDLADLLHQAIATVQAHGGVFTATNRLTRRPAGLVHTMQWVPASAQNLSYRTLGLALGTAATTGRELAAVVGVPPRPGLADARAVQRDTFGVPPSPVRLAGQWYPQHGGMAEPAPPPPAAPTRSSGGRQPGPRRTR